MNLKKIILTYNDCYKSGKSISPKGIVVHSTGANNKKISRYVQPDDGIIGINKYKNDWNRSGISKCVHAFIGVDKNGNVCTRQTLPWDMRCWGCGSGSKGSYNDSFIQFEICEDALDDEAYFNKVFNEAAELCAYLMKEFPLIKIENVVSHAEANKKGYASAHSDCDYWLKNYGKDMNWFRNLVQEKINPKKAAASDSSYLVKVTADLLNVRAGAGISFRVTTTIKKGQVYTITEEKNGWGKLKSGSGWINLKYTMKV